LSQKASMKLPYTTNTPCKSVSSLNLNNIKCIPPLFKVTRSCVTNWMILALNFSNNKKGQSSAHSSDLQGPGKDPTTLGLMYAIFPCISARCCFQDLIPWPHGHKATTFQNFSNNEPKKSGAQNRVSLNNRKNEKVCEVQTSAPPTTLSLPTSPPLSITRSTL
jgi:hypothetical protein